MMEKQDNLELPEGDLGGDSIRCSREKCARVVSNYDTCLVSQMVSLKSQLIVWQKIDKITVFHKTHLAKSHFSIMSARAHEYVISASINV